ncbi:MAG: hydantoin racemase [Chloroflexi bacterium]|nr:hydantoin racemase [Chloroflexota bacterium]
MTTIGLIRVLTTDDPDVLARHGRLIEAFIDDPELRVVNRCIEGYPEGLWNERLEREAVPAIVALGQALVRDAGADALFVSCAADPGVPELRQAVSVPVVGAGSAAAAMALSLGRPVGAISIVEGVLAPVAGVLGDRLVGWGVPDGVKTTLDLMSPEGKERAVVAARRLLDRGAGVILLACTGFSTIGLAPYLQEQLGCPVIDPVVAGGLTAYYAAVGNQEVVFARAPSS